MMGKSGINAFICSKLSGLMRAHPYDPKGVGSEVPEPYLLADAVKELFPQLSDEDLNSLLLYTSVQTHFLEVCSVVSVGNAPSADKVVAALARDIIRAYAADDDELTAESHRRETLYVARRWPSA